MTASIHEQMPREAYDRSDRVNFSTLKLLARSPAHYLHALTGSGGEDSDARKVGRATHIAIFEPDRYRNAVAVWDGGTRRGREWEKFKDANEGRELLTEAEAEHVKAMSAAVRANKHAAPYITDGKGEVTVLWTARAPANENMGAAVVEAKSRLDFLKSDMIVDLKTGKDASPRGFGHEAWKYRYLAQAAMYVDAVADATGKRLPYAFVVAESKPPYVVQVYRVTDEQLQHGRDEYHDWLRMLVDRKKAGSWPGYFDGVTDLELPRWAMPQDDDDVSDLGLVVGGDDEAA